MIDSNSEQNAGVVTILGLDKARSTRHRLGKMLLLILIIAAAMGLGTHWYLRGKSASVAYETQPVQRGNLVVTVSATGTLEPIKKVDVGIEVSGTVESVEVDYNDQVEVGQILARLDTSKLEAQALQSSSALDAARAKLLQAQATVQEAGAQMLRLEEVRKLSDGKMPSQSEFDTQKAAQARAKADEASAKAAVAQAQATLDANQSDLAKAVVHSPIDGVVLVRSVEPGQTVAAMFQSPVLFTLAEDLTQMELQVDVDEADVGMVREGQEATFTVDAYPEELFPAHTTQVRYGAETTGGVVTYKTILKVDNASLILRPGMTATAMITVDKRENALLVPNAALRFRPPEIQTEKKAGGGSILNSLLPRPPGQESSHREDNNDKSKEQQVWVLRDGQLDAIPITRGLSDGRMTEVTGGDLNTNMELVTDTLAGS
jgi:HlyD family secretion protein